jgi:hypothetical protein
VTDIWGNAFDYCYGLTGIYFQGNAPNIDPTAIGFHSDPNGAIMVFSGDTNATAYYLPGTTGWSPTFGGIPAVLWNPQAQTSGGSFGVRTNEFGFNITGTSNIVVVVEGCSDLANPIWTPIQTNTLVGGLSYFSDPEWTNHPACFYRLSFP